MGGMAVLYHEGLAPSVAPASPEPPPPILARVGLGVEAGIRCSLVVGTRSQQKRDGGKLQSGAGGD